jgi:hypothetical protein
MQSGASGKLTPKFGHQKSALGRSIVSRQTRQFGIEVLETQAEAKSVGILEEQLAYLCDPGRVLRLREYEFRDGGAYPINRPPFTLSTWPVI